MADSLFSSLINLGFGRVTGVPEAIAAVDKVTRKLVSTKEIYKIAADGSQVLQGVEKNFKPIVEGATQGIKKTNDFVNALKRAAIVAPVWMVARAAMMGVLNLVKEQIKFLKDMETAMARIKIVGKGTAAEYDNLKVSLLSLSMAYGISASDAMQAAKTFAQQGRTVQETFQLTRIAMISAQVLGENVKDSVNNITSAIEGFNIPVEDSISIVDKWINVERQFAVTSKDLAEGIKVAGATANQLGVSIDALAGDLTAIVEVTRKTGTQVGNALQFIYSRVFTTGKQALESIAKIPLYLNEQGIATTAITGKYRGLTDVLEELAGKWGKLGEKEKLEIAVAGGSRRQLASYMALMQNYNTAIDARIASLASAGAAERAFGIMQDTVAVKSERLTSSWNNLTAAIADTGAWKAGLDAATAFLKVVTILSNQNHAIANKANKDKDIQLKVIETQKSQAKNLKELIEMRDRYLTRPPTDKNIETLGKINNAIETVFEATKNQKGIKFFRDVDINAGDVKNILDKVSKEIEKEKVTISIGADYDLKIDLFKKAMEEAQDGIKKLTPFEFNEKDKEQYEEMFGIKNLRLEIKGYEGEILKIAKEKTKAIEDQINLNEVDLQNKKEMAEYLKIEAESADELTTAEKQKIDIQSKLNIAKSSGVFTAQQLLNIEIDLVKAATDLYGGHALNLKLYELESEKSAAILEDYNKRISLHSEIAKFQGVEESSIIRQEMALKSLVSGEDYLKNSFNDRLKLAQALSKEMDEQNKKSSHMVELYKIAKKYGMGTAQEIARYQAGEITGFQVSPEARKALKRVSPGILEQIQAEEFFRPTGFRFPEELEKERIKKRDIRILQSVMVEPISINVRLQSEEIIDKIMSEFKNTLLNKKSELFGIIDNIVEIH
ncbi:MAG: phage tail tape measure protein [Patescibacteria group bacterium]